MHIYLQDMFFQHYLSYIGWNLKEDAQDFRRLMKPALNLSLF